MTVFETTEIQTPIGGFILVAHDRRVCAFSFADRWERVQRWVQRRFPGAEFRRTALPEFVQPLEQYFAGDMSALARIAVDPGGTAFQHLVWTALQTIPPGQTMSYGELARAIGAPAAVRAVGLANGANPIAVIIPCHRVIGANGTLVGYGGGLERKRWLLVHERAALDKAAGFRLTAVSQSATS